MTAAACAPELEATQDARVVYIEEDFEATDFESRGWYDNTALTLSTQERVSGEQALEVRFERGARTATLGGAVRRLIDETESVHISYWVKYAQGWEGSGRRYHPHELHLITNLDGPYVPIRDTHLTTYVETSFRNGGIRPRMSMQDRLNIDVERVGVDLTAVTERRAAAGCNGNGDRHRTGCYDAGGRTWANEKVWTAEDASLTPGAWHFVEAYFQLNTIEGAVGRADGKVRYRLDGELVLDLSDVLFRTGAHPSMRFRQFVIAPYIGDGSPVAQKMWLDDLTVANRR